MMLTKNETKDITKVIRSLKNKGISLKRTIEKTFSQEGGFLGPLMRIGLLLLKDALMPLAKSVLVPLNEVENEVKE